MEEFLRLSTRNNLDESKTQQTARYINGLRLNIQDQVSLHRLFSVEDAQDIVQKIEMQLERTSPSTCGSNYSYRGHSEKKDSLMLQVFLVNKPLILAEFQGVLLRRLRK